MLHFAPIALTVLAAAAPATSSATLTLRGQDQTLRLFGARGSKPAVVASGDGGWVHLGPTVAAFLASQGYFVVGFDSKAYLTSFTTKTATLTPDDVKADLRALLAFASQGGSARPLLAGVSEGAGLAALAATDPALQSGVLGVVGLGLGDRNELGWRFRDSVIYVTKGVPNEPTFSVLELADRIAPVPLAVLNSSHDEFVPEAEVRRIVERARDPKRLWIVEAADHRFSDNAAGLQRSLLEAIAWVEGQRGAQR
jgi:dienelactone hydrolase